VTWVKLCGLTREADVAAAAEAGADAIGLVTAPGSPRAVTVERAAELAAAGDLPAFLVTVGLAAPDAVAAAEAAGVAGLQPHGPGRFEAAEAALAAGLAVLFPVLAGPSSDLGAVPDGAMPILDSPRPGTGTVIDWAAAAHLEGRFVLAGGLTPDTVGDAVAAVRPWGVDVSSGIESAPGVKDHAMMRRFVEAARW
jgi:phosphoribosylanthranilate isomerase